MNSMPAQGNTPPQPVDRISGHSGYWPALKVRASDGEHHPCLQCLRAWACRCTHVCRREVRGCRLWPRPPTATAIPRAFLARMTASAAQLTDKHVQEGVSHHHYVCHKVQEHRPISHRHGLQREQDEQCRLSQSGRQAPVNRPTSWRAMPPGCNEVKTNSWCRRSATDSACSLGLIIPALVRFAPIVGKP